MTEPNHAARPAAKPKRRTPPRQLAAAGAIVKNVQVSPETFDLLVHTLHQLTGDLAELGNLRTEVANLRGLCNGIGGDVAAIARAMNVGTGYRGPRPGDAPVTTPGEIETLRRSLANHGRSAPTHLRAMPGDRFDNNNGDQQQTATPETQARTA
jgi:hypothetical protein